MTLVQNATENKEEEIEDPVEKMLQKTGCIEYHYKVQECIATTQDWRKCQDVVKKFRDCMDRNRKQQKT